MSIYQKHTYPISDRVDDLLGKMTLPEKVAQLGAQWLLLNTNGEHQERGLEMSTPEHLQSIKTRLKNGYL